MWNVEATTSVTVAASPVVLYSVTPIDPGHQVLHYSAYSGANVRGGYVHLNWIPPGGFQWIDKTTDDIGDTSGLTLSAGWDGGSVKLSATSTSGTWTVNTLVVAYERRQ